MPTYRTTVRHDGSVELPLELRERLGIESGAEVEFFLTVDGEVFFHAIVGKAAAWPGLVPVDVRRPPVSIREMDEGIAEHIVEDYERILRQSREDAAKSKSSAAE
jgi:bifunctional DNA-binding transcriptional regulator/antitoxin component of YhaV-PrlF toxin-antitoxin module